MKTDWEKSGDAIRQQVRQEIAEQLFDLLPTPTIAKVCDMTVEQVWALVRRSESEGTVAKEQSNKKPRRTIKMLDQPISRTTIPIAVSTKRLIQSHQEMLCKLKKYL